MILIRWGLVRHGTVWSFQAPCVASVTLLVAGENVVIMSSKCWSGGCSIQSEADTALWIVVSSSDKTSSSHGLMLSHVGDVSVIAALGMFESLSLAVKGVEVH